MLGAFAFTKYDYTVQIWQRTAQSCGLLLIFQGRGHSFNKKVSYRKQITQRRVSIRGRPHYLAWLPCKMWLLFLILCAAWMSSQKFGGRWGPATLRLGRGWPLDASRPPVLPCQIWSLYVKQFERNYGDLPENFDPSVPPFNDTQGHWDRHGLIGYLWLPISVPR